MQRLLNYGNEFIKQSDWKDFALVKFCLCAIGIMWGLALPKKARKTGAFIAAVVFVVTYIPLMLKLFKIVESDSLKKA